MYNICSVYLCYIIPIALCLSNNTKFYLGITSNVEVFMTDEMSSFCLAHIHTSQFDLQFTY